MRRKNHSDTYNKISLKRYEIITLHGQSSGVTCECRNMEEAIERLHPIDGERVEEY